MKTRIIFLGLLLSLGFLGLHAQTPYFYYYEGERQYFDLDTRHVFISVTSEKTLDEVSDFQNVRYEPLRIDVPEGKRSRTNQQRFWTVLSFEDDMTEAAYRAKLTEVKNANRDLIVAPYFKNRYQDKIGLSNFFYVKLKNLNDTILLRREAEKEDAVVMWQNEFMPLWFVLSVTERSKHNAMELSNKFYESGLFLYAEPDLIVDDSYNCASDPDFGQQWGHLNTGQNGGTSGIDTKICDAWQIATGNNVVVAVLDQGIELSHIDLSNNIHPLSFDSESRTSPQRIFGSHGTVCGGVIGAIRNNGRGVAGVAPNSKIMSISNSLDGTAVSREARADGINWAVANGADIINNSWGSTTFHQVINDAITNAVNNGRQRNGISLGCIVIFASGNNYSSTVSYPANLLNVIAVGAINRNGNRADFSQYGDHLNVVAPGVDIRTTTLNNGYTTTSGTSLAAPYVAGVAALLLSANPNLTQTQVRHAIESTCTKLTGYSYSINPSHPHGTWNNQVGHGLVNAHAALLSIPSTITGPADICPTGVFSLSSGQSATWSASAGFSVSPTVGTSTTVSHNLYNGATGTLTAVVNGVTVTRTIQACNKSFPAVTISGGHTLLCSSPSKSFSASNWQTGYTWGSSINVQFSGGITNSTVSATGRSPGTGWISVNFGGRELARYSNFWVGVPSFSHIDGPTSVGSWQTHSFTAVPFNPLSNPTYFEWSIDGGPPSDYEIYNNGSNPVNIYFHNAGYYQLTVYGTNACGAGHAPGYLYIFPGRGGSSSDVYYPNPVKDVLYVVISQEMIDEAKALQSMQSKATPAAPVFDVRLYDGQGKQLRQQFSTGGTIEFSVSNLASGVYFLHIYDDVSNMPKTHLIVVEH